MAENCTTFLSIFKGNREKPQILRSVSGSEVQRADHHGGAAEGVAGPFEVMPLDAVELPEVLPAAEVEPVEVGRAAGIEPPT